MFKLVALLFPVLRGPALRLMTLAAALALSACAGLPRVRPKSRNSRFRPPHPPNSAALP